MVSNDKESTMDSKTRTLSNNLVAQAEEAETRGEFTRAINLYRRALSVWPTSIHAAHIQRSADRCALYARIA
jgi:hypothetical protein